MSIRSKSSSSSSSAQSDLKSRTSECKTGVLSELKDTYVWRKLNPVNTSVNCHLPKTQGTETAASCYFR